MPTATYPSRDRALRQLRALVRPAFAIKRAGLGGSDDVPFEQAFSTLASSYVRDKAPKLLQYELGFQLLEKNDEGSRAVGVFGFKIGAHYLYAPVFFLNGDLKGHELLYLKNQDLFVPMKENWVNYLLGRKPLQMGESVSKNLSHLGVTGPTLYQLVRSPYKYASDWRGDAMANLAYFATTSPASVWKDNTAPTLPGFIKAAGPRALQACLTICQARPEIFSHIERFHGKGVLEKLAREMRSSIKQASASPNLDSVRYSHVVTGPEAWDAMPNQGRGVPRRHRYQRQSILDMMATGKQREEKVKLEKSAASTRKPVQFRIADQPGGPEVRDLTGKQREFLLKERYVIFDDRKPEQMAHALDVETPLKLQNPTYTAVYEVLVRPDRFRPCLVVMSPWSQMGQESFCTVVDLENKKWSNTHPSRVWIHGESSQDAWKKWWDGLPGPDKLGEGLHMVLTQRGQATTPFRIRRRSDKSEVRDGCETLEVDFERHCSQHTSHVLSSRRPSRDLLEDDHPRWQRLRLTGKTGARITRHPGGELWLPAEFKVLTLTKPPEAKDEKEDSLTGCCAEFEEPGALELGNLVDVQMIIQGETYPLRVYSGGRDVSVTSPKSEKQAMSRAEAIVHLVMDHDLGESAARDLVGAAQKKKAVRVLVKRAAAANMIDGAPSAPSFPEPQMTYDPISQGRVPAIQESNWGMPVQDLIAQTASNRELYNPLVPPDHSALQAVSQAAQTGQREVFDTAMLGTMLHSVRDDTMIDRFLPDVMKGMNALGRILFNFYWHQDNFGDRYGKSDLPEIEDSLRNAFEASGDILLALKAKRVNPQLDEGISPDLSEVANA